MKKLCLLVLSVLILFSPRRANAQANLHHYLYVATPGIRNYLEYGGHGLLVFDMDNGFRFVKRIATKGLMDDGKPSNVKGIAVSAFTECIYLTTLGSMQCIDLNTEKILWEKKYEDGCDRLSVSPDGKTIYLPTLEKDDWKIVDAKTGNVLGKIVLHSGSHNTLCGPDGKKVYMEGLQSDYLTVVNTDGNKIEKQVGPFANHIRPFTIDASQKFCFVNIDGLLGFEVGDLQSGKKIAHVEVAGFKQGPVKRHGCPSHGIALSPDEKEIWLADAFNQYLHVFSNDGKSMAQINDIRLSDQPGWITFSIDGKYALPSTGEIIDAKKKTIIATLVDETGARVQSEKMVEVIFKGTQFLRAGDQFGVGRK
jgi:DNA-binding beta-propeller fold protein YncE